MENVSIKEKVEDRIIDFINLNAGGRLIVFKPEEPIKGISLVVKKKGEYESRRTENLLQGPIVKVQVFGEPAKKKTKEIYVSVNILAEAGGNGIFAKNINIKELVPEKNFYLIFTFFNVLKQDIDDYMCILSLEQFEKITDKTEDKDILRFESFLSSDKKDKYSEFLVNKKDLSQFFLRIISPV